MGETQQCDKDNKYDEHKTNTCNITTRIWTAVGFNTEQAHTLPHDRSSGGDIENEKQRVFFIKKTAQKYVPRLDKEHQEQNKEKHQIKHSNS